MHTGSYIGGEWVHPNSSSTLQNINPADTSDRISEFRPATAEEVEKAVEVAKEAQTEWRQVPAPERARLIWRVAELARDRTEEIAQMMTREEGKILREARGEARKGINVLEFYAGEGFRLEGKTIPSEARNTFTYTIRRPLGVVGLITPWNFPWAIPCWKIAPALVAGNTVVFKPSEVTPGTAAILVELFEEAGCPPGVLNMVVGTGEGCGEPLVAHPDIKAVSFTGSNEVGNAVYEKAARRGVKVTCEMGGKNACILLDDGDLEAAVDAVFGGAFGSTGQRCTATSRAIVHPDVKDAFLEKLIARARDIRIGHGLDDDTDMGPVVDEQQYDSVRDYIELGKSEATVAWEGELPEDLPDGYYVAPIIFDDVTRDMRIFQEEIFGPALCVSTADSLDEAISLANDVKYGLTSSLFTRDVSKAMQYIEEIETGMVHVNEPTIGGEAQLPFGGVKGTGIGDREMAKEGLEFFTELKTVFINFSGSGERLMIR